MYIKSLKIRNLRTFRKVELDFQYPARPVEDIGSEVQLPNVNLLLGDNGQGKTTVLRAIALSVISSIIRESGYVPYAMVRRKSGVKSIKQEAEDEAVLEGEYVLHDQDVGSRLDLLQEQSERKTRVVIERVKDFERIRYDQTQSGVDPVWENMYDNDSPAFLMVGYGATRRLEQPENYDASSRKRMVLRYMRIAGLFQESFSLIPLERWLPELKSRNPGRYTQVVHLINRLLEKPFSFKGHYENDEYYFQQGRSLVPLGALSDGYRAYIGWIADLLYHICMGCPSGKKLVENKGIVLVDEVDLHLHPSWQRTVVPVLAKTFSNLQFIVTSHSPIITGSLHSKNIWAMAREGSASKALRLRQSVHGLNADQVLVSDYFGLESSRAPSMQQKIRDLNLRALQGDNNASLELLGFLAGGLEEKDREEKKPAKKKTPRAGRKK